MFENIKIARYGFSQVIHMDCIFSAITVNAQILNKVESLLKRDTAVHATNVKAASTVMSDSARIAELQRELEQVRLQEANARMEMESMKLGLSADSVRLAMQRHHIDSLKKVTKGVPLVVDEDTLLYFYTNRGGYTPAQRAEMNAALIEKLGNSLVLYPDSVKIESTDIVTDIMYKDKVLISLTDKDAMWEGVSRDSLALRDRAIIVAKLTDMNAKNGVWQLVKRIVYLILIVVGQYVLFRLTNWLFRKLKKRILLLKETKLKPFKIQEYELLDTAKQVSLLLMLANLGRYLFMLVQLLFTVPLVFIVFPQTEKLAYTLLGYLWMPIRQILKGIVDYIPNLFTIVVIWLAIKYMIRLIRYLAREVEAERLKINGFYPDWAMPTYHIVRFLLYAFMIAMIYPYLPGANSGVFQGISVFVGLIVSLGLSTVIANIIAGLVITYMRPYKLGDRIKLNDTTGNVVEKTPLVTRIHTPKNELITIPNSFIMSSHTVNYSSSAREYGLIIHSEVTIGYDAPWRKVHQLLIDAALNTPGVIDDPRPFVLETSLSDWYPVYQINAYIRDADRLPQIYSNLHQNIQDYFNEAGIEIMSPHYMAMRDGNETTIPKNDGREKKEDSKG